MPAELSDFIEALEDRLGLDSWIGWTAVVGLALLAAFLLFLLLLRTGLWILGRKPTADAIRSASTFFANHFAQLIALLLLVPLLVLFFKTALAPEPDVKEVTGLAVMALILAFFVAGGQLLLSRLKKLGPLELFDKQASSLADRLEKLIGDTSPGLLVGDLTELGGPADPLSPTAEFEWRRIDFRLSLIESLAADELAGSAKQKLARLLLRAASFASWRQDWLTAKTRLEWLRKLLGDRYDRDEIIFNLPHKLAYNLGVAYLGQAVVDAQARPEQALSEKDRRERRALLHQALDSFDRAAQEDRFSRDALFNRAWVEDELGMWPMAIESNRAALRLSPHDAPAKYNMAISLIKMDELEIAVDTLLEIVAADERAWEIYQLAATDEDLDPLREDPTFGPWIRWWIEDNPCGFAPPP